MTQSLSFFTFPEDVGFAGDDSLADRVGQRAGQGGGVPGSNPAHELVAGRCRRRS